MSVEEVSDKGPVIFLSSDEDSPKKVVRDKRLSALSEKYCNKVSQHVAKNNSIICLSTDTSVCDTSGTLSPRTDPWNSSYTLSPVAKDIQERSKNVIEAADENGSDSDEMVLRTPEKTSNAGDLSTHSTPTIRMLRLGSSPDVARNVQNNSTISAVEASPTYPKSSSTVLDITVVSSDDEVSATPAKRTRYDFYTSILEAKTPQATPKKPPRKRKPAKKAILSPVNMEKNQTIARKSTVLEDKGAETSEISLDLSDLSEYAFSEHEHKSDDLKSVTPDLKKASIYGPYYRSEEVTPKTAKKHNLRPLTPEISYEDMSVDQLAEKCRTYGVKKLSKERMIIVLKQVYAYLHQTE